MAYSLSRLVKYGRLLGYDIEAAKGKNRYRIKGIGVFTKKQLIRIIIHMEDERIEEWT